MKCTGSSRVRPLPDARQPDGCRVVERQARQGPQMRYCLWAPESVETPMRTYYPMSKHGIVQKLYNRHGVFTFTFANPFCGLLCCNFFLLHNLSKPYSV